jgi:hypothetical protein
MISLLQRIEKATPKPTDWFPLHDKNDTLYGEIAFKAKYIERELGHFNKVRLTTDGKATLKYLINLMDHQRREIERHTREKRLLRSHTASTLASIFSTVTLVITLIVMYQYYNSETILRQPIQIEMVSPPDIPGVPEPNTITNPRKHRPSQQYTHRYQCK